MRTLKAASASLSLSVGMESKLAVAIDVISSC